MMDVDRSAAMNEQAVRLTRGSLTLEGILGLPTQTLGMVVFAHGSGSGRFSLRNNFVARHLEEPGTLEEVAEQALTWFQQYFNPLSHEGPGVQVR